MSRKSSVGAGDDLVESHEVKLFHRSTLGVLALCLGCGGSDQSADAQSGTSSSETSSPSTETSSSESASAATTDASTETTDTGADSADASTETTDASTETTDASTETTDATSGDTSSETGTMGCEGGPEISVLFIGNSYTYFNDLPTMVAEVACSAGYVINQDSSAAGGYSFGSHLNDANTQAKIAAQPWDLVILQNQSQIPGFPESQVMSQSVPNAEGLVALIEANHPDTEVM